MRYYHPCCHLILETGKLRPRAVTMAELRCEGRLPETVGPEGSRAVQRLRRGPRDESRGCPHSGLNAHGPAARHSGLQPKNQNNLQL